MKLNKAAKTALKDTVPILIGYLVLGMGFGILFAAKGYSVLWAFLISIFIYAGSMQYLAVDLLANSASLITTALTTLVVQARHAFYGLSLLKKYKGAGLKKLYLIYTLTDETYSLVCTKMLENDIDKHEYYFFVSIFNHCYWIVGCTLGAFIGNTVSFNTKGIDFALTAVFVTIFIDQWMNYKNHTFAIIGVVSAVICLNIFGADNFLIPSMLLITFALSIVRRITHAKQ